MISVSLYTISGHDILGTKQGDVLRTIQSRTCCHLTIYEILQKEVYTCYFPPPNMNPEFKEKMIGHKLTHEKSH